MFFTATMYDILLGRLFFMSRRNKVLVIGLDCAPPELVFDQWRDELPNFRRVMDEGVWGKLESCIPAITVPAWSSMMSRSEEHTSELQSHSDLVCRLLLEKKK